MADDLEELFQQARRETADASAPPGLGDRLVWSVIVQPRMRARAAYMTCAACVATAIAATVPLVVRAQAGPTPAEVAAVMLDVGPP